MTGRTNGDNRRSCLPLGMVREGAGDMLPYLSGKISTRQAGLSWPLPFAARNGDGGVVTLMQPSNATTSNKIYSLTDISTATTTSAPLPQLNPLRAEIIPFPSFSFRS